MIMAKHSSPAAGVLIFVNNYSTDLVESKVEICVGL